MLLPNKKFDGEAYGIPILKFEDVLAGSVVTTRFRPITYRI